MKQLIFVLLFSLFFVGLSSGQSADYFFNDKKKIITQGVDTCTIHELVDGKLSLREQVVYNKKGMIVENLHYTQGTFLKYKYDHLDRMIEEAVSIDGRLFTTNLFHYNETGEVFTIHSKQNFPNKVAYNKTTYQYNNGLKISESFALDCNEQFEDCTPHSQIIFTYNADNNLVNRAYADGDGEWLFNYDDHGKQIEAIGYASNNQEELTGRELFSYNDNDQLIFVETHHTSSCLIIKEKISYNKNGLIETISLSNIKINRRDYLMKEQYLYTYSYR